MSGTMRDRFYGTAEELVDADERIAVVLADIGTGRMPDAERAHADRVINVASASSSWSASPRVSR